MSFDTDSEGGFEVCSVSPNSSALPFNPSCIENVILAISDRFDFRIVMSDDRVKRALLVTTGLSIAGGLIGRHYGGKVGAAVGGAVGGALGAGCAIVTMRSVWSDIKGKLSELFEIVYDYLAGLGLDDYKKAAMLLSTNGVNAQLAMLILETASSILGKKIISSLNAA